MMVDLMEQQKVDMSAAQMALLLGEMMVVQSVLS